MLTQQQSGSSGSGKSGYILKWSATCMLACLPDCLPVCLPIYSSDPLTVRPIVISSLFLFISRSLSLVMRVCLCLLVYVSTCLSVFLSVCLSACLSVSQSASLSVSLFLPLSLPISLSSSPSLSLLSFLPYVFLLNHTISKTTDEHQQGRTTTATKHMLKRTGVFRLTQQH